VFVITFNWSYKFLKNYFIVFLKIYFMFCRYVLLIPSFLLTILCKNLKLSSGSQFVLKLGEFIFLVVTL